MAEGGRAGQAPDSRGERACRDEGEPINHIKPSFFFILDASCVLSQNYFDMLLSQSSAALISTTRALASL